MSMREKWKVVKKLSFGRYLHTTKSIGPNRLVHVGGYGQHPVEVWVGVVQYIWPKFFFGQKFFLTGSFERS